MMRNYLMAAACSLALALAACTESSESYSVASSDAYATLAGAGYSGGIYPLPIGLKGADVSLAFEAIPTDQTAYWKFTRNGKELGRVNAVVEGDATSSTVSYSYAKGEGAAENVKIERLIRQYMQPLIVETIDAKIEKRPYDIAMKRQADSMTAVATVGGMMNDAHASMEKAAKASDERAANSKAEAGARSARYTSTRPTTDLSKY